MVSGIRDLESLWWKNPECNLKRRGYMETINWGIIGCGNVTEMKSGPALQKAAGSNLVAVMRRNGELARDYAQRHNVPRWYDDADKLINDPEVNAVYIATPPSSHKEYTLKAAEAGKPVYVEKPMARNYAECRDMIAACEKNRVPLFVAYYRRALPRFLKIKSLLEEGAIGEVRFVNVTFYKHSLEVDYHPENWRVIPEIAGCGYFCDLASHTLDILQYMLGDIEKAQGFASNQTGIYEAEDIVSGNFVFESGAHGSGVWNFSAYEYLDRNEIVGEKGKTTFATFGESPIVMENSRGKQAFAISNPPHIQQPLIQTIVDELRGSGKCPSTGISAAKTSWVMDKMLGRL